MIFRPDLRPIALAGACLLMVGGCSEAAPDQPPLDRALAALDEGDGFGAELILREMLGNGVARADVAAFMGQAELQQGQPVEARNWLGEGRFSDATAGRGFHMLGRLEMREGNLPAAGTAFDNAYRYIPDDPKLWVDIGRLRYRGGEQAQAVDAAIRAVELGPEEPDALLFRAQLARDSEGMAAALPWFERALRAKPRELALLGEYAATLGEAGEAQDMLGVVRKMADLNPGFLRIYYLQAVTAARAGKYDLARKLLQRSGSFIDATPAGTMLAGVIDLETGNYASAAQQFDRLARQQPENHQVRDLLARALAMGGSHRELVYRFGEAAEADSATPYLMTLVARSHEALGDREAAAALLDRAGRRQPETLFAIRPSGDFESRERLTATTGFEALDLVREYITEGRGSRSIEVAEDFRRRFAGSADALSLAGDAYLSNRRIDRAIDSYAQSARIRQSWPLARRRFFALQAQGKNDAAQQLLEDFLIGHSGAIEPALLLARAHYDTGDFSRAQQLLDHAILAGADRDPELLSLRAVVALRMDQPELARRIAVRSFEVNPLHPASLQAMAMVSEEPLAQVLLAKNDRLGDSPRVARR